MGFEADSAGVQLAVKPDDLGFDKRTLDFYGEIADAQVKQLLIAEAMPGESVAHGGADSTKIGPISPIGPILTALTLFLAPLRVSSEDENLSVSPAHTNTIRRKYKEGHDQNDTFQNCSCNRLFNVDVSYCQC